MKERKWKSSMPVIITLVLTGLVMVLGNAHWCHLHSTVLEVILPIAVLSSCCFWTARAKSLGKAWLRTGLSFLIAVGIQMSYLGWLHSPVFPDALLSRYSNEQAARMDELRKRSTQQRAGEATWNSVPSSETDASQP